MVDNNETNIRLNMDVDGAISSIRRLQAEISNFHQTMSASNRAAQKEADNLQKNLINSINKTRAFSASMQTVSSSADTFTAALEKNKLTMSETFRHIMGSSKMFSRQFSNEFDTITATARERVKDLQTQYIKLGKDANGAVQTIKIRPLLLDLDDLGTKTMLAAQKQQILNKLIAQGSTQLLNWGKNTQWAGRQLMVGFTVPLTMMGAAAAQTFMEIEKEIIKVQRVYGDFSTTVQETDAMVSSLKKVALEFTKWGVSVKDTMALAADAAATGKTGQELISQVTEATRLAVLGNVDQAKALETTMSVANAFGTSADQLAGKINFLNAVENQSVTSIEDLTTAIPTAAPVIKQLGGNVEDLAFFLTAMREGGIDASEGANALKSGLASMINPTKQATDFLGSFGINLKGIVDANKGNVKGMIVEFAKALDTLDPTNRARAIEQLFGKFQFARMSTLFQNVIKEGSQAQRVLDLTNASAQELAILSQRELSKVEESTTYKFQAAMEKFQAALAPVGEQFLKAVTPIIEFGTKLLDQFNSWSDGAKQFSIMFAGVVGGIGPVLLMAIGLVANGVANLIKFFQFLSGSFKSTGKQATVLGTETEYMTQAQLQASAAASALGQTHSKLPQIFTAERTALDLLTAAYERSIAVQRTFPAGQAAAAKTAGKKYAKGVVSVPGPKGAGDVVPAMLSPGEAVIPAGMAKKYAPLISGMVAGNIPGFEKGTGNVSEADQIETLKNNYKLRQAPEYVRKQTQNMVWGTLESEQKAYEDSVRAFYEKKGRTYKGVGSETSKSASHVKSDTREVSLLGKVFGMKNWKAKNLVPDLQGINNFINNLSQMTTKAGANPLLDEFKDKKLAGYAKRMGISMEEAATELENLKRGVHPVTERSAKLLKEVADFTPGSDYVKQLEASKSAKSQNTAFSIQRQAAGTSGALGARLKGSFYKMIGRGDLAYAADTEAKAAAQQEKSLAAANARGVAMGLGGAVEPAKPVKKPRTNAPKPNTSGQVFDPSKAAHARAVETRVGSDGKVRYFFNGQQIKDTDGQAAMEKVAQLDAKNERARAKSATPTASANSKPSLGQRLGGAASKIGSHISGRAGMYGGMAMMGASMIPGLSNIAGPLSMVGMALTMLPGPAAAAVSALGLVGYGIFKLVDNMNQAKKAGIDAANAMSLTSEKLKGLSEVTGTVSATELRKAEQASRVAGPQTDRQKAFGETFFQTDQGKSLISDVSVQRGLGKTSAEIGKNLGTQLSEAIAQGVLSPEQAQSIAINLGEKLKDYQLSLNMQGQIASIVGPNGENLAKDPLKVVVALQVASIENIQSATQAYAQNQGNPITDSRAGVDALVATGGVAVGLGNKAINSAIKSIGIKVAEKAGIMAATSAIGAALAPETVGISAAAAAVADIGITVWGIVDGIAEWNRVSAENAKLAASTVQAYTNAYSQSVGLRDVLNQQYDNKIKEQQANYASATTDKERRKIMHEMILIENDRAYALQMQAKNQSDIMSNLVAQKDLLGGAYNDALKANIEQVYKENEASKTAALSILDQINALTESNKGEATFKTTLQMQLASGELDPFTMKMILEAGANSTQFKMNYLVAIQQSGDAKVIELMQKLFSIGADAGSTNIAIGFAAKNPGQMDSILSAIDSLKAIQASGGVKLDINSKGGQKQLMDTANMIARLSKQKKLNFDVLFKIVGSSAIAKALADSKAFMKLPKKYQVEYAATYTAVLNAKGDPTMITAFKNWLQFHPGKNWNDFAAYIAGQQVSASQAAATTTGGGTTTDKETKTGGGGGGSTEPKKSAAEKRLDALNKKLDKQQKALAVISLLEEEVNKKYDERKKALEKIAALNARISEQQRGQLDVADAISRGDIAAAAKAAQDLRSKAQDRAAEDQLNALEVARQAELDSIAFDGMTRKMLEDQIHSLELDIAKLEYQLVGKKAADQPSSSSGGSSGGGGSSTPDISATDISGIDTTGLVDPPSSSDWWSGVTSGAQELFTQTIPGWWEGLMSNIGTWWNNTMSWLGQLWDTYVAKPISQWWTDLMNNPFIQGIGAIFSGTAQAFNEQFFQPVMGWFGELGNGISQWWTDSLDQMGKNFQIWGKMLSDWWTSSMQTIQTNWNKYVVEPVNNALTAIGEAWDTYVGKPATEIFNNISSAWNTYVVEPVKKKIDEIAKWWDTNLVQPIKKAWQSFMSWLGGDKTAEQKATDVKNFWKTAFDSINTWWTVTLPGGIKTAWDKVVGSVKSALNVVIDALNKIGKLKLPGNIFGIPLPPGIANATVQLWNIPRFAKGGIVPGYGSGDIVPSLLTPGEFVMKKSAVQDFGADRLRAINNGTYNDGSMYNYSVVVNAGSNASADEIANAVMTKIKGSENQRLRGSRI